MIGRPGCAAQSTSKPIARIIAGSRAITSTNVPWRAGSPLWLRGKISYQLAKPAAGRSASSGIAGSSCTKERPWRVGAHPRPVSALVISRSRSWPGRLRRLDRLQRRAKLGDRLRPFGLSRRRG